ncbi:TPA: hypothetical protein ACTYSZ_003413 [Klebsiella aerogenes]
MTKSTITRERLEKIKSWRETYGAENNVMLPAEEAEELARMALAAMDSEPVAVREPIAWLNDAYLARGVVDGEAGSEDAGPGYIPVYREAQSAPVVPDSREQFEAWAKKQGLMSESFGIRSVNEQFVNSCWEAWQESRAAMLQASDTVRDLSTPVDPQVAEYEQNVMQAGNSPVNGVTAGKPFTNGDVVTTKSRCTIQTAPTLDSSQKNAESRCGNSPVIPDGYVGRGENCWSCGKYFTYEQHSECDGYCPHCDSPVDLDDEEDEQSKSLPANPTEEMVSNAWREALGKCDHETIRRMYIAMFAAAPQEVK